MTKLLSVDDLSVGLTASGVPVVEKVSFGLEEGEVLGLVGESGSGKTTVATALLAFCRRGAEITGGAVRLAGVDILGLDPGALRSTRGRLISYVPQDPMAALNPAMRIRSQLEEVFTSHDRQPDHDRIAAGLDEVGLPHDDAFLRRYPHQLSGGQRQRVCLAAAFLLRPSVVVLDEPTTGLDVTTQARVLVTVRELCSAHRVGAVYVSHDLAVVSELADTVAVMYAGKIVEIGRALDVFDKPSHPYTAQLMKAIPDVRQARSVEPLEGSAPRPGARGELCRFADRCPAQIAVCALEAPPEVLGANGHRALCHRAAGFDVVPSPLLPERSPPSADTVLSIDDVRASYHGTEVVHGVSLDLKRGECFALVGESGSGKTTLARAVVGLHSEFDGAICLDGHVLRGAARDRAREDRRRLQYIFQSPFSSLNPRKDVRQIIEAPIRTFFNEGARDRSRRVESALEQVSLDRHVADQYPSELSGGERQRVAIARALACEPEVLVCDEVTSALDVSVQASILDLLGNLQRSNDLALLFITHDLGIVRALADRVAVMLRGEIVEFGTASGVLNQPSAAYTIELLSNTPTLSAVGEPDRSAPVQAPRA